MFHRAPLSSSERQQFLTDTRESLIESLGRPEILEALGDSVVQRLKDTNELLFTPEVIEDAGDSGDVVSPFRITSLDAVPIVALRPKETVHVGRDIALPSPRQNQVIQRFLDALASDDTATERVPHVQATLIESMSQTIPVSGTDLQLAGNKGQVESSTALIDGEDIKLGHSPGLFVLSGRPRVVLAYKGGYPRSVALAHELIHVDQALQDVITPYTKAALLQRTYRHELEAHHYSALYINALNATSNPIKSMWAQTTIPLYEEVEKVRRQYADPESPFEPNERLVEELQRNGISWGTFGG